VRRLWVRRGRAGPKIVDRSLQLPHAQLERLDSSSQLTLDGRARQRPEEEVRAEREREQDREARRAQPRRDECRRRDESDHDRRAVRAVLGS
jgi:hypothetical protein